MMLMQIILVALFAVNLLLAKMRWYSPWGKAAFIIIPLLSVFPLQPRFELDYFWWRVAGVAAMGVGLGILIWALREFKKNNKLITSGPYYFVRHPQYLGLMLIFVGWWWVWAAVYAFYFGMFILALIGLEAFLEERYVLEKLFGASYRKYAQTTGMFWIK